MSYKSKRSRATDIDWRTKLKVWERDNRCCIICGKPGQPNAHYISRAHGGLGIEENIVTLCQECHNAYDNGDKRVEYGEAIRDYLKSLYPDWNESDLLYKKWQ